MIKGNWRVAIRRFSKRIDVDVSVVTTKLALNLFKNIVLRTPVDTGRARASWVVGVNNSPRDRSLPKTKGRNSLNSEVNRAIQEGTLQITKFSTKSKTIEIANGLPYIQRLERGSSRQAPNGMVALSVRQELTGTNSSVSTFNV